MSRSKQKMGLIFFFLWSAINDVTYYIAYPTCAWQIAGKHISFILTKFPRMTINPLFAWASSNVCTKLISCQFLTGINYIVHWNIFALDIFNESDPRKMSYFLLVIFFSILGTLNVYLLSWVLFPVIIFSNFKMVTNSVKINFQI